MYIIMDLDQTLLNDTRRISEYSLSILNKLKRDGHIIVINTARSFDATKDIINILNPDYTILNGGALIVKGMEVVYENYINNIDVNNILKEILENKTEEFSIEYNGLFCNLKEYEKKSRFATYFDFSKKFPYNAYKILLCSEDGVLPNTLSKKYNLEITHYVNGPWYRLSVCTKQDGNIALYKLLKDTDPKSICFGDDLGDIEMLECATIGVALSNSVEKVLKKIEIKTKYNNNDDGVCKYLEEYFYK